MNEEMIPPEPTSENERRRETMLAYYLGALEPEQEALIRGRIETSPEWQAARLEAKTMLNGLKRDAHAGTAPATLAERTLESLRNDGKPRAAETAAKATVSRAAVKRDRVAAPVASPLFTKTVRVFAALFVVSLITLGILAWSNAASSVSAPAIYWRTESELASGGPFAPSLQIRDAASGVPASASVTAQLYDERDKSKVIPIGTASTDETGTLAATNWRVPAVPAGKYILQILARSGLGTELDRVEHPVTIAASNRLALAPDRTQARPGETLHVRALALSSAGQTPVRNTPITFDILDPRGNRINRVETRTSNFGLAWAEFRLDTAAPEGAYKLTAISEGLAAEREVNVKQYALPAYQTVIAPAKAWFKKNETINGTLDVHTFDGQRISDATSDLTLTTATGQVVSQQHLNPAQDGRAAFSLPWSSSDDSDRFALILHSKVTDGGGRVVECKKPISIAGGELVLSAIPEARELVPGVANRVYLLARSPDGRGMTSHLIVHRGAEVQELDTDAAGVAALTVENPERPAEVIEITDRATGVSRRVSLPIRAEKDGRLLLRTDRAIAQGGQTLTATLLCGGATPTSNGVALVSLRKGGSTVFSKGVKLSGVSTSVQFQIPEGSAGLYSLDTVMTVGADAWTDRRSLLVTNSSNVRVVASADRASYKPGQRARLNFNVTDASGKGLASAVSVLAVDEALLTLTGENPGLAQALLSDESGALSQPDLPLDVRDFGPAQGDSPAALAALAHVAPKLPSPNSERNDSEEFIDHSAAKLEMVRHERKQTNDLLKQCAWALGGVSAVFVFTLLLIWELSTNISFRPRNLALTGNFIGWVTAITLVAALGILLVAPFHRPGLFVTLMAASLVVSHAVLIWHGIALTPNASALKVITVTVLSDCYLLAAACLAAQSRNQDGEVLLFILFGALPVVIAQLTQSVPGNLVRIGIACAGLFFFAALILPTLGRAREKAAANGRGFVVAAKAEAFEEETALLSSRPLLISYSHTSAPHVRWNFPETMIFAPEIITDENGNASFELGVADSLTRWRVQTDAVAQSGGVAQTQSQLIVTQPFSVDLILPASVTAGDVLRVPAVVSNHTGTAQRVDLAFDVTGAVSTDGLTRELMVGPDASAAAEFTIRFTSSGTARFRVTARPQNAPAEDQDAIERTLTVIPDGEAVAFSASGPIAENGTLELEVPDNAIPGTVRATLNLHRGPLTQMIEGLDSMLQEPHGCFEQTSSSTYPNIMILRYLKAHEVNNPQALARAKQFIEQGYQRLLTFEVNGPSGSFSLFGQAPASTWLTAYGLQEFNDMSAVFPVDPALLERMRGYLIGKMRNDGSFDVDEYHGHEASDRGLAATAYVVHALGAFAPAESIRYLANHRDEIRGDPYLCALCANALLQSDRATASQLASNLPRLFELTPDGKQATLPAKSTLAWGYGRTASTEASALGALALLQTGQEIDAAQKLLAGLQGRGAWSSTHATVLALKALECAASRTQQSGALRIVAELNGDALPVIDLKAEETGLPVSIPLTLPKGKSKLRVQVSGGALVARVTGSAWVPWQQHAPKSSLSSPFSALTTYDVMNVAKNQSVLGTLNLTVKGRRAEVPMIEWGLAAGFQPNSTDLDALKTRGVITRWELSGRSLHLYLPDLNEGSKTLLSVRFTPTAGGTLTAQPGRVYEYYSPADAASIQPVKFDVK